MKSFIGQTYVQPEIIWEYHGIPMNDWVIEDTEDNGQILGMLDWSTNPVDTYKAIIAKGYSKSVAYIAFRTKAFHQHRLNYDLFTQYWSHIRLAGYKEFI